MPCFKRLIASVLVVATAHVGMPLSAQAGLVGTEEALGPVTVQVERNTVTAFLLREDVRAALQARGVDPQAAAERAQALNDQEVAQLAGHIDRLPAGGTDVLGFFLLIFVVLLFTDVLGMTKVFPFTRAIR